MENTHQPGALSVQDKAFWRTVHTHTRGVYEQLSDRLIAPQTDAQEVAVEALGIVHAMAHIALQQDNPLGTGLCAIEVEPRHDEAARSSDTVFP